MHSTPPTLPSLSLVSAVEKPKNKGFRRPFLEILSDLLSSSPSETYQKQGDSGHQDTVRTLAYAGTSTRLLLPWFRLASYNSLPRLKRRSRRSNNIFCLIERYFLFVHFVLTLLKIH